MANNSNTNQREQTKREKAPGHRKLHRRHEDVEREDHRTRERHDDAEPADESAAGNVVPRAVALRDADDARRRHLVVTEEGEDQHQEADAQDAPVHRVDRGRVEPRRRGGRATVARRSIATLRRRTVTRGRRRGPIATRSGRRRRWRVVATRCRRRVTRCRRRRVTRRGRRRGRRVARRGRRRGRRVAARRRWGRGVGRTPVWGLPRRRGRWLVSHSELLCGDAPSGPSQVKLSLAPAVRNVFRDIRPGESQLRPKIITTC